MNTDSSSRERMLAALECREPDHAPCCFSAFSALRERCADDREFLERQLAMGLDAVVQTPSLPVRHDASVETREWVEHDALPYPLLHKEYATPAGVLHTSVSRSEDWPHGDHVPFFDDFLIPRSEEFLVTPHDDLDALGYLLTEPSGEDAERFGSRFAEARALADELGLLTMYCYGMVGDVACWLGGMQGLMMLAADEPGFVRDFLGLIERWNARRMDVALAEKPDLFVRRAWYEHADIWSPRRFEEFLLPGLRADVERAHAAGVKFGYLMSCSSLPLVDMMVDAGVDVLLGIDPAQDRTMDLAALKAKAAGRMALWGGVCGYLTIECGTTGAVRRQVREAMDVLGPDGFILAPVTNIRGDSERVWANIDAMVDEWRSLIAREDG